MTSEQARNTVDGWILANRFWLLLAQRGYLATMGRYYQMPWTHTTPPTPSAPSIPDNQAARYNGLSLGEFFGSVTEVLPMPFRLSSDEYIAPQGPGWIAHLEFELDGETHCRQTDFGPLGMTTEWAVV